MASVIVSQLSSSILFSVKSTLAPAGLSFHVTLTHADLLVAWCIRSMMGHRVVRLSLLGSSTRLMFESKLDLPDDVSPITAIVGKSIYSSTLCSLRLSINCRYFS